MSKAAELAALIGSQTALSNRNLIINGAMQVAQRGTSATAGNGNFVCDRFRIQNTTIGAFTVSQSTNAPDGFSNSTRIYCDTAEASPAASDIFIAGYRFEGQDLQHLQKGSSSAKSITLSFWVRSNKTGTYCMYLFDNDTASYRSYSTSYSISSANTWTYITHTFAGDTSGALDNDVNRSLDLSFGLATGTDYSSGTLSNAWQAHDATDVLAGQVNLADTVGNFWEITGVQLELGETATPFEHRSYGDELQRCMRYFERIGGYDYAFIANGRQKTTTQSNIGVVFKATKRANPTESLSNIIVTDRLTFNASVTSDSEYKPSLYGAAIRYDHSSYGSANNPILVTANSSATGYIDFDSEL
jgi:hypothetical protein